MMSNDYVAHSALKENLRREPHWYVDHVKAVEKIGMDYAQKMLSYATCLTSEQSAQSRMSLQHALRIHDIGKLESGNQAVLRGERSQLPYDHVDGGVAVAMKNKDRIAAWLVRAHHAPGLASVALERALTKRLSPDSLLRGKRHQRCDLSKDRITAHQEQIAETDALQDELIYAHETACGHQLTVNQSDVPCDALTMRLLLSCLVDADHGDTAAYYAHSKSILTIDKIEPRWQERLQKLVQCVKNLQGANKERQELRNKLFYQCLHGKNSARITTCAAPVGLGKTTSVMANLICQAQRNGLRRIFVIAPFTNIITQTADILRRYLVLKDEDPFAVVAEHHHRADFSSAELRQYAHTWKAPIVVTTAVQFFETLASASPTRLRKLHELPGSAIFIDEAHACVPPVLMRQSWYWIKQLADQWSCYFVLASGSLVKFWEHKVIVGEESQRHLPSLLKQKFYNKTQLAEKRRVKFARLNQGRAFTKADLLNAVSSPNKPPTSKLIILNTVQSAAVVAQDFQRYLQPNAAQDMPLSERIVLHISTALTPHDRNQIIQELVNRQADGSKWKKRDWYLVATSCVESGVDLDFDFGYRERCSVTSFLQTAGRINREGQNPDSVLYDFALIPSKEILEHPAFSNAIAVFNSYWDKLQLQTSRDELSTSALVKEIQRAESKVEWIHTLLKNEKRCHFQKVQEQFKIIESQTITAIVDDKLKDALQKNFPVSYREIQRKSVQIWHNKIDSYGLTACDHKSGVYFWNYDYDTYFLGYMKDLGKLIKQSGWVV